MRPLAPHLLALLTLTFTFTLTLAPLPAAPSPAPLTEDPISEPRIERLFRPLEAERMALSPDGHYLAHTQHVGSELMIDILDLETLTHKTRLVADEDRLFGPTKVHQRASLRFLEWATPTRLVFAPPVETIEIPSHPFPPELIELFKDLMLADRSYDGFPEVLLGRAEPTFLAPISAVDFDGRNPRQLLDIDQLKDMLPSGQVRTGYPFIVGISPSDRTTLNLMVFGRGDTIPTKIWGLNLSTGKLTERQHNILVRAPITRYATDHDGLLRGLGLPDGVGWRYESRPPGSDRAWQKLPDLPGGGALARFTRSPENYLAERNVAMSFDYDANVLIYASNVGRDTFGIYGFNLATRQRTPLALEHPTRDLAPLNVDLQPFPLTAPPPLVFDRFQRALIGVRAQGPKPFSVWLDPAFATVQRALDTQFSGRNPQILDWNETHTRFLVQVTGGNEPGRVILFEQPDGQVVDLFRRAPWLNASELHPTRYFEFTSPDGALLTGYLTQPKRSRIDPPPVLLWFADGAPPVAHPDYDPQAQVFADLGFIVCRLNQRGTAGLGSKQRAAFQKDFEHTPGMDALATLDWLAGQQRIDRKRVALYGQGFAGHLAIRTAQLHPESFRCLIAFDPILNLRAWVMPPTNLDSLYYSIRVTFNQEVQRRLIEGSGASLSGASVTSHAAELKTPTFFIIPKEARTPDEITTAQGVDLLRSALKNQHIASDTGAYPISFLSGHGTARTKIYRQLSEFLNLNLYDYDVQVGTVKEVK